MEASSVRIDSLLRRALILVPLVVLLDACGSEEPSATPVFETPTTVQFQPREGASASTDLMEDEHRLAEKAEMERAAKLESAAELERAEAERAERDRRAAKDRGDSPGEAISGSSTISLDGGGTWSALSPAEAPRPSSSVPDPVDRAVPDPMEIK
jgi:hypothetical protein